MIKKQVRFDLKEQDFEMLKEIAHTEHRTIKATVELLVKDYLKSQMSS